MKQQSLTWFTWKKFIITCIVLVVLGLVIYFYLMFQHIHASTVEGFDKTEAYILEETDMTTVDNMFMFQEEILYHIAYTRDKQDKKWIQYIPITEANDHEKTEDNTNIKEKGEKEEEVDTKEMITVERKDTLSQPEIEDLWSKECQQCELTGSTPAILDDVPLWELTYIDGNGRYVIEYRQLKDGKVYEQLKLNRKYNVRG